MLSLLIGLPGQTLDSAKLDVLLNDAKLKGAVVSATVADAEGRVVYSWDPDRHVVPASNQKLLSNAFALHVLGADYRPRTSFWRTGRGVEVEATGDPMMTSKQLVEVRQKLRVPYRTPIYVWQAYAPVVPDTWEHDDLPNRYAARVTAFSVDRGGFELWGENGRAFLAPYDYGVSVKRESKTRPSAIVYDPFKRVVSVSGEVPKERKRLDTLAIPRPDEAAAWLLGGSLKPLEHLPSRAPDLVLEGSTSAEMVAACLAPSDNNIAEHLLLLGSLREGRTEGNPYAMARERLTKFLTRVAGLQPGDVKPYDGSGMSRHNYVTTRGLVKLLTWADQQSTRELWRAAMATPGKGTLVNRLQGVQFAGKTGTLDMVVALSGYVKTSDGADLTVSVIFNSFGCSSTEARNIADEFVKVIASSKT